jgi:hypothetical protein
MSPFGDCALETGVKGIAGEEGQDVGKSGKPRVRAIVVDHRLESGDTANGFSGTSFHMVHIVVVNQTQIRRACSVGGVRDGEAI